MASLLTGTTIAANIALHAGNVATYAFAKSGAWAADLVSSYGYTRETGMQMSGGSEFVVLSKSGQGYLLVDGSYIAAEAGGFYSTNNSSGGTLLGFYADTTASLNFNTTAVKLSGNQVLHAGNVATYALPIGGGTLTGTLNGTTASFSTKVLSSRFHDSSDAFLFRSGSGTGTARHINLADSNSDPSSVGSATGITCGERSDNAAYYMIYVKAPYNNGNSTHSRLVLGWHTGMEIGANAAYGGVRFMADSPGVSTSEIFSVGKGDSNVRVANTIFAAAFSGPLTGTASGNLTAASSLTAGNLSGTIPSGVLGNSTLYVGSTAIALNRASAAQTLTGVNIDGYANYISAQTNPIGVFNVGLTRPKGASYTTTATTVTGAIKIKMPPGTPVHGMWKMTIKIYEYGSRGNGYTIECGCHLYPSNAYNRYQYAIGVDSNIALPIRYGTDGTSGCIWIGENATTWYYPQIHVTEFSNGFNNPGSVDWSAGTWGVTIGNIDNSVAVDGPYTIGLPLASTATTAGTCTGNAATVTNGVYTNTTNTITGQNYFQSNLGTTLGALNSPPLQAYATGTNAAFMSFHRGGNYAVNMGLDSDNVLRIGGWSAAANRLQLDMSGNLTVAGGMYASIFYDSDNNSYYANPSATSNFNELTLAGVGTSAYGLLKYGGTRSGDWQSFTSTAGQINVVQVENFGAGGHTNYPTGVYTYGGVMSWRTANHSFQLYAAHTGDLAYKTQWNNDNYSGWRRILDSSTYPHAANMNQYVRSTDSPTFVDLFVSGLQVRTASPTITLRDTDHRTGFIHVNSNIFYVLTGGTDVGSGNWGIVANSRWPLEINLSNNNATFGADVNAISFTGAGTGLTGTAASLTAGAVTNGVYTTGNQTIAGTKTFSSAIVATNAAKAWVHFNGTGNIGINANYNVSSITDNGTGDYTVNFTSAFVDTNYVVAGTATIDYTTAQSLNQLVLAVARQTGAQSTGSCRLATEYIHGAALYDAVAVRAVFYR